MAHNVAPIETSRPNWSKVVYKLFGFLHLAFAVFGLYVLISYVPSLVSSGHLARLDKPSTPYIKEVFIVRTAINLVFLVVLAVAAVLLLELRDRAVTISNWLFTSMILYFGASALLGMLGGTGPVGLSIAGSAGIGNVGITPQLITGYPLISLVVLNLARRRLSRRRKPSTPEDL